MRRLNMITSDRDVPEHMQIGLNRFKNEFGNSKPTLPANMWSQGDGGVGVAQYSNSADPRTPPRGSMPLPTTDFIPEPLSLPRWRDACKEHFGVIVVKAREHLVRVQKRQQGPAPAHHLVGAWHPVVPGRR